MKVLAIIVDYAGAEDAARLGCALARTRKGALAGAGAHASAAVGVSTPAGADLRVVHLDNGNARPVALTDAERAAGVELLRAPENRGYAAGLNFAVRELGQDYDAYWFLNPDLEVENDCLSKLVAVLEAHADVGAVGPRVLLGQTERVWGARGVISPLLGLTAMTDWPQGGRLPRWSYIPGCSLLVRAEACARVGGMTERYRLYFEETDFCVRLQKAGFALWVEPSAIARHAVKSRESGVPARHFAYYFARNNLYFWHENFGIPWLVQMPRMAFVVAKELLVPLRHAHSLAEATDRLRYVLGGVRDSVAFLREPVTPWEKRLFPGD